MNKLFTLWVLPALLSICTIASVKAKGNSSDRISMDPCFSLDLNITVSDTLPKVSLLKKITDFLKFRKNIRSAERQRILNIIHNTFLKDSIMANAREIHQLNLALTDTVNQKFDSLVVLLNALQSSDSIWRNSSGGNMSGAGNDTAISESELNALIDKILPIIIKETNKSDTVQQIPSVRNELSILRTIKYFHDSVKKKNDTVEVPGIGKLTLTRKAPVYAFYPSGMEGNYLDYNFDIINSLVYDGYLLNGETGQCANTGITDTSKAMTVAKNAKCGIFLTVRGGTSSNIARFLMNENQQWVTFIGTILNLMRIHNATGINIDFANLSTPYRTSFVQFIHDLNGAMKSEFSPHHLMITIPPGDNSAAYDLNELNEPEVRFLIDFSIRPPGAPAGPVAHFLGGNDGIKPTVSRYLNSNVPPDKFIVCLPYYGTEWKINPDGKEGQFIKYLSLNEIASQYDGLTEYDSQTRAAFINLMPGSKQVTGKIWFNDEKSLNSIYDFILANGLGGIAIRPLKTKIDFSGLWTGLGNQFLSFDTLALHVLINKKDSAYMAAIGRESFRVTWDNFRTYDSLSQKIYFLFDHPCETYFPPDIASTLVLKDSTLEAMRMSPNVQLFRVLRVTKAFILSICLLILTGFLIVGYFYINKLRKTGKSWKSRKTIGGLLLILAALLILLTFTFLFLSNLVPGFGANSEFGGSYDSTHLACYDMPFQTLLLIIISGIILGVIIMRYLIFPLLKKDDIP